MKGSIINYSYLIDDAKINLSTKLNNKLKQYNQVPTEKLKLDIINLIKDRRKIFLFDKDTIRKYLN